MSLRTLILALSLATAVGCVSLEERDTFQDKRNQLKRAAIDCGADTACLQKAQASQIRAGKAAETAAK